MLSTYIFSSSTFSFACIVIILHYFFLLFVFFSFEFFFLMYLHIERSRDVGNRHVCSWSATNRDEQGYLRTLSFLFKFLSLISPLILSTSLRRVTFRMAHCVFSFKFIAWSSPRGSTPRSKNKSSSHLRSLRKFEWRAEKRKRFVVYAIWLCVSLRQVKIVTKQKKTNQVPILFLVNLYAKKNEFVLLESLFFSERRKLVSFLIF